MLVDVGKWLGIRADIISELIKDGETTVSIKTSI